MFLKWPRTRKFSELLQTAGIGRQLLLTFSVMVTRWSRSTSSFYALIAQNLTGEFMRKIYAASGNLFTDSWSWQSCVLLSCDVFNCLFSTGCTKWNTAAIKILLLLMVCLLGFWLRNAPLVKVIGNLISDAINFVFHLSWCVRGWKVSSDSGLTWWPSGPESRLESLRNYCIWCYLFVSFSSFM